VGTAKICEGSPEGIRVTRPIEERICETDEMSFKSGVKSRRTGVIDGESKGGDCDAICAG